MITSFKISSLEELQEMAASKSTFLLSIAAAGIGYVIIRKFVAGGKSTSRARLDGKTVIITGANTGIGKETAHDLASRGANVIIACRDKTKGKQAADDIKQSTGRPVTLHQLDLSSLTSIRKFAAEVNQELEHLDILINNAAVGPCPFSKSEDGYELQFATNQLGQFLLTLLLLDLLHKSAPSRVIVVSGKAYEYGDLDLDNLNGKKSYHRIIAYIQSKIANIMFALELSALLEGKGVTVNALHPGVIHSELGRHLNSGMPWPFSCLLVRLLGLMGWLFFKTPKQGAQTTVHCAVAEELEDVTGQYFSDCKPKQLMPHVLDINKRKELWKRCAEMVKLTDAELPKCLQ